MMITNVLPPKPKFEEAALVDKFISIIMLFGGKKSIQSSEDYVRKLLVFQFFIKHKNADFTMLKLDELMLGEHGQPPLNAFKKVCREYYNCVFMCFFERNSSVTGCGTDWKDR